MFCVDLGDTHTISLRIRLFLAHISLRARPFHDISTLCRCTTYYSHGLVNRGYNWIYVGSVYQCGARQVHINLGEY